VTDTVAIMLVNALDRNVHQMTFIYYGNWLLLSAFALVLGFVAGRGR